MANKNDKIFGELWKILVGEVVTVVIMFLIFFLFDAFNLTVVYGAILGAIINIICFCILCITIEKIIQDGDQIKGLKTQRISFIIRLVIMALTLFASYKFDCFNAIATVVPLIITRPTLSLFALFDKGGEKKE